MEESSQMENFTPDAINRVPTDVMDKSEQMGMHNSVGMKISNLNPLQTKNVRLRALEPRDVDLLYRWENDPEVWKVSNTMTPFSKFTLQEFIKTSTTDIYASRQLRLMVEDWKGNTVGAVDVFDFEPFHRRAGIGILIAKDYRHHGYAEEAVHCVCQYLFSVFQLHQVYCNVMADNEISLKLFQHIGFQPSGVQKDWIRTQNGYTDVLILQLINECEK
jgi:diamine N-acetyltransferase